VGAFGPLVPLLRTKTFLSVPINSEQFVPSLLAFKPFAANLVSMNTEQAMDCRELLAQEFLRRRNKNQSYSLRGFARDLKLSPAALSEVLNRKRALSKKNLLKICERLGLSPSQRVALLSEKSSDSSNISDSAFLLLKEDTFQLMSSWYYMAILSLAETQDASADARAIATRLGIKEFEAKEALAALIRLKFIQIVSGCLKRTIQQVTTSSDVPSSAIRKYHSENLKRADESLQRDAVEIRDFSSINMAMDPDLLPEAKDMIKKFRRRLSRFLESGKKKEVYTIAIQLFPVSRPTEVRGEKE
jgi:transcriptional regulator with XRE-family HTH domain